MRALVVAVVLCAGGVAAADPSVWDRSYKAGPTGSSLCPGGDKADIVVADGKFSIPWTILAADEPITIAHIVGTVRPSGMTENVSVDFVSPMPRAALKQFKDEQTSFNELRTRPLKVSFRGGGKREREISVTNDLVSCGYSWTEDREAITAVADGPVDCNSGEYAVALWSKAHPYKSGEYTRLATPGKATRLYRCIDACKAGADPVTARDDEEAVWAFFGECAGKASAEAALPTSGAPKWDTTYVSNSHLSQDWRCFRPFGKLVVSKGKFTIPWKVESSSDDSARDDDSNVFEVGHIDGVIAADGKVTLRPVVTATELPPEVIAASGERKLSSGAALAALRNVVPTMTFELDVGKMNPRGQGRRSELAYDKPNACEYQFEATDYKSQQFKESDGWRVDCNSDQAWQSKHEYVSGDLATVSTGGVAHQYRCSSSKCRVGGRPGNSGDWSPSGRCR